MRKYLLWWLAALDAALVIFCLWAGGVFSLFHWRMWYHWLWHDVCGLPQPFTFYMRESANAHPYWWILTPIILGISFYLFLWFYPPNWWANTSERAKHLGWYLGSIVIGVLYYILICHLWGIL